MNGYFFRKGKLNALRFLWDNDYPHLHSLLGQEANSQAEVVPAGMKFLYHLYGERDISPHVRNEMKWNESGFRPPLCTYRLNWARRTSWGWWDDWDDTVLQTQDSKFEPWRSEAEHATSRSRRLPTILTFTRGWGRNNFVSFKPPRPGTEPRTLAWKAAVLTTTLGPPPPPPHVRTSD